MALDDQNYGVIRFYNFKKKTAAEERAVLIIGTADGNIIRSIGNEVFDNPAIVEYCASHPKERIAPLFEYGRIMDVDHVQSFLKYFHHKYIMDGKRFFRKPKVEAIVCHGRMDEETKRTFSEILGGWCLNPLVLSADEILQGNDSMQNAIWQLAETYPKIRGVIEIDI